jgi:hypothetical protein
MTSLPRGIVVPLFEIASVGTRRQTSAGDFREFLGRANHCVKQMELALVSLGVAENPHVPAGGSFYSGVRDKILGLRSRLDVVPLDLFCGTQCRAPECASMTRYVLRHNYVGNRAKRKFSTGLTGGQPHTQRAADRRSLALGEVRSEIHSSGDAAQQWCPSTALADSDNLPMRAFQVRVGPDLAPDSISRGAGRCFPVQLVRAGVATGPREALLVTSDGERSCTATYRRLRRQQLLRTATMPHEKSWTANLPPMTMDSGFRVLRGGCTQPSRGRSCTTQRRLGMSGFASGTHRARSSRRPISFARFCVASTADSGSTPSWMAVSPNGGSSFSGTRAWAQRPTKNPAPDLVANSGSTQN